MKNQLIALFLAIALPVMAKDQLKQYDMEVHSALISGQIAFASDQACAELRRMGAPEANTCGPNKLEKSISDGKALVKNAFAKALKSVSKPAARAALKEYYIAGISAIQGIEPQAEERKINYEKRQGDNKSKLDEMWTRFEVEE